MFTTDFTPVDQSTWLLAPSLQLCVITHKQTPSSKPGPASHSPPQKNLLPDRNYVGVVPTLEAFGPLLKPANPEATLLTTFMNWTQFLVGAARAGFHGITHQEFE